MAARTYRAHDDTRVKLGTGTIRLVRDLKMGPMTIAAGKVGDLLEVTAAKRLARCWFGAYGTTVSLDDLEPVD